MHSLFERYFKGELEFFELAPLYQQDYKNHVKTAFPPNRYVDLGEKYYETGLSYLNTFEGLPSHYEVVEVEDKANIVIENRPFVGFIDLVLRDKNTNDLMILDHKSKADFKSDAEYHEYLRQLYLYAAFVKEKYGEYPTKLTFHMFRIGKIIEGDFQKSELEATKKWFLTTIDAIYHDTVFEDKISRSYYENFKDIETYKPGSDFFCAHLCSVREHCPRSGCMKKRTTRLRK